MELRKETTSIVPWLVRSHFPQECDFDGRSTASPLRGAGVPSPTSPPPETVSAGSQCHFTFQGLRSAGQGCELRDFAAWARFFVDSPNAAVVEKSAGPLEVDAAGRAHAAVTYPSMLNIWPEVYNVDSIRVIEVCVPSVGTAGVSFICLKSPGSRGPRS